MVIRVEKKTAARPKQKAKPEARAAPIVAPPVVDPKATVVKAPRKLKAKPARRKKSVTRKTIKPGTAKKSAQDRTGERKLNLADVVAALRKMGGLKTAAAQELGVARSTLYVFLAENQDAIDALTDIDEEIKDVAESKMLNLLRSGDPQTVRWYLELKAKDRGYVRRIENTGAGGGPVEFHQKQDLSALSEKELEILAKAASKRESASGGK